MILGAINYKTLSNYDFLYFRSINPPCVPYYGEYQSKILFVQEGMKDFLGETSLINFTKRRKVSDIISEIQQYQNQPYCLKPCPEFREYLENLDPFPDMKDEDSEKRINDYLWKKSNEVEPRDVSKRKPVCLFCTLNKYYLVKLLNFKAYLHTY